MPNKKITNEFELIKKITSSFRNYHSDLVLGVGDDTAVIRQGKKYQLLTCDALVENDHFHCNWSTPEQIGRKAVEVNVSDIAASGGEPLFLFVTLVITKDTSEAWVKFVYAGIKKTCDKYRISLAGGDTTHGENKVISIALSGITTKPILRSGARVGDLIAVTGVTGGSTAGLRLFLANKKVPRLLRQKHLEPQARLDVSAKIAHFANSMIDVSDGVASEVRHIATNSRTGAIIYADQIPLCSGATLEDSLSGGEDFELLFTFAKKNLNKLKKQNIDFTVIGKITQRKDGLYLMQNNKKLKLPGGYDHFKK